MAVGIFDMRLKTIGFSAREESHMCMSYVLSLLCLHCKSFSKKNANMLNCKINETVHIFSLKIISAPGDPNSFIFLLSKALTDNILMFQLICVTFEALSWLKVTKCAKQVGFGCPQLKLSNMTKIPAFSQPVLLQVFCLITGGFRVFFSFC